MNATGTPGGSGIPAGWYDDPSGLGLRWWDGEQWTEHVHSAESAAAAVGSEDEGDREGAPPRDLVKLRESIHRRGTKSVGMVLGAAVLIVVIVALLVSGGSDDSTGGFEPAGAVPGIGTSGTGGASQQGAGASAGGGGKAAAKALKDEQKALEEAGVANPQQQVEAAEEALKNAE